MEDADGSQIWTGMLDDLHKAETHAMFLPTEDNVFKFVPPHRWYRFQKRASLNLPSLEDVEKAVSGFKCICIGEFTLRCLPDGRVPKTPKS